MIGSCQIRARREKICGVISSLRVEEVPHRIHYRLDSDGFPLQVEVDIRNRLGHRILHLRIVALRILTIAGRTHLGPDRNGSKAAGTRRIVHVRDKVVAARHTGCAGGFHSCRLVVHLARRFHSHQELQMSSEMACHIESSAARYPAGYRQHKKVYWDCFPEEAHTAEEGAHAMNRSDESAEAVGCAGDASYRCLSRNSQMACRVHWKGHRMTNQHLEAGTVSVARCRCILQTVELRKCSRSYLAGAARKEI